MNEDERGITPANVTSISVSRDGDGWWVIIEQGNGDVIKDFRLTEMERIQLGMMLDSEPGKPPLMDRVSFVDFSRDQLSRESRQAAQNPAVSAGAPASGE